MIHEYLSDFQDTIKDVGERVDGSVDDYILEEETNETSTTSGNLPHDFPQDFPNDENVTEVDINDALHVSGYLFAGN